MTNAAYEEEYKKAIKNVSKFKNLESEPLKAEFGDENYVVEEMFIATKILEEYSLAKGYEYMRNTPSPSPTNDVPWLMFASRDKYDIAGLSHYGDYSFVAHDKGAIDIDDIMEDIKKLALEYYEVNNPTFYSACFDDDEVLNEAINPTDITDSAGIFDDRNFVQYLWDNYFEDIWLQTNEIPAIKTDDGLIVFDYDKNRIKPLNSIPYKENGTIIPLSERFPDVYKDEKKEQKMKKLVINMPALEDLEACRQDILSKDGGIESQYETRNLDNFLTEIATEHGFDCVALLITNHIKESMWDGRYSSTVKTFSAAYPTLFGDIPGSEDIYLPSLRIDDTHPIIINFACQWVMENEKNKESFKPQIEKKKSPGDLLFEKMSAEQDKYRDWLLGQSPAEVLNHTYEYTIREDILCFIKGNDLSDKQANALLKSASPLADIYKDFDKRDYSFMNEIRDTVESKANQILGKDTDKSTEELTAAYLTSDLLLSTF